MGLRLRGGPIESKEKRRIRSINLMFVLVLTAAVLFSLCVGKYPVTPIESVEIIVSNIFGITGNWEPMTESVVMKLRLTRTIAAVLVGSSLAVSGATYQGIFRNPLVSPDLLGVSSGACIGAAIAILMALPSGYIQLFAFCGGLLAVTITLLIPRMIRSDSNLMLVLSGIIVGGLMSSIMGFIKYTADPDTQLAAITYWQMGSLSYIKMTSVLSILPTIVVSMIILFAMSWWIDIVSLGEKEAKTLGANVRAILYVAIACSTLLTASSVCIAGTIGWVGLVIPHFARLIVGPDNTKLLPAACLIGAIFLLLVDTAARTIGSAELPLSILTGIIGAPFYAWLLYKQRMRLQ
ncbi:MAG: iron ABC transporter permease [Firmicutes bacterium HGW-Firmicutes-15]|nr:MAG: iron ABC transporter permease [Firmicutes bacterium HGW-Firmicutes-15]